MKITRQITVFDAPDLEVESAFWAGLLGGTVDKEDDWHSLYVDDIGSAHEEALGLGARVLKQGDHETEEGFTVYADPAGHPFCLCWG